MNNILSVVISVFFAFSINAQSIDKVEAIIGEEMVLTSDIESQYLQYLSQGNLKSEEVKCEIIEDLLFQKLLINQSKRDSIIVADDDVDAEINKRLQYFESQLGSAEKVEEYFGKTKVEIEIELGKVIKDQFLAQKMQATVSSNVKVTPSEVMNFLNNQNQNSLPEVPTKVEVTQLIIKPIVTVEEKDKIRAKLNNFRERVYNGEDFKMLATLYSDDPGSASSGGELGFVNRGDLVPEFERAAFRLKEGEISEVVESQFGFHIVQLIERRGEQINVRHILLKTKVSSTALNDARIRIEEIEEKIKTKKFTFEQAIESYSDDESKNNGGLLLNPNNMSTMHTLSDMAPSLKYTVENLSVNQMSNPVIMQMTDETQAYRILKLNKRVESHIPNLVDDFSLIKDFAINSKKQYELMLWIEKTINTTYIRINENLLSCNFNNKWIK
jgi:peptidyl-prolyl cis-trans isomerase SurA